MAIAEPASLKLWFGKYRNHTLAQVPRGYLRFLLTLNAYKTPNGWRLKALQDAIRCLLIESPHSPPQHRATGATGPAPSERQGVATQTGQQRDLPMTAGECSDAPGAGRGRILPVKANTLPDIAIES
jgi:hypothetical protein